MRPLLFLAFAACFFAVFPARADSGADALFDSVGKPVAAPGGNVRQAPAAGMSGAGMKLDDPFLMNFFSHWQLERDLPYEVNLWAQGILKQDFTGAAHLWSVVQPKIPASFEDAANAGHLYLLWKLDLPQTFFDEWLDALAQKKFRDSTPALALDQTVGPTFDNWLYESAPTVSPEQESIIERLDVTRGSHYATLHAWTSLRKGKKGERILPALMPSHPLRIPLAETVMLDMVHRKDLKGAAHVLKQYVEPTLQIRRDPYALAAYDLEIGRLLYQAGALDGAETFYEKIPNGVPQYLEAREELAWVRLRKGEKTKLRGDLETLRSGVFSDRFSPEVYLTRAISDLKLCYYDEVQKDFQEFLDRNRRWAKEIVTALNAQDSSRPRGQGFVHLARRESGGQAAGRNLSALGFIQREYCRRSSSGGRTGTVGACSGSSAHRL